MKGRLFFALGVLIALQLLAGASSRAAGRCSTPSGLCGRDSVRILWPSAGGEAKNEALEIQLIQPAIQNLDKDTVAMRIRGGSNGVLELTGYQINQACYSRATLREKCLLRFRVVHGNRVVALADYDLEPTFQFMRQHRQAGAVEGGVRLARIATRDARPVEREVKLQYYPGETDQAQAFSNVNERLATSRSYARRTE